MIISASEAEQKWGLKKGTVRSSCTRGKLMKYIETGEVRKSGNTWLVTENVMSKEYGKINDEH